MFINNHRHCWPVRLQCYVLQVSASGYYAWLKRPEPQLSDDERKLVRAMREIDEKSNHTFGSRRMYKELRRGNLVAGRHKMRRLMREDGIRVKRTPRRALVQTTDSQHQHPVADNRLNRNFTVTKPNTVWAADITYVQTNAGYVYLAVVMDLFSRRIIGWHLSETITQQLTITALWKAWKNRSYATGMLIHSDRGSQYAAAGYRQFLTDYCKATQSMSRKGNCWDNAPVESFFATLKTEEFNDINFVDLEHLKRQAAHYIENIYNRRRLHSTLGYTTPVDFENNYFRNQKHLH